MIVALFLIVPRLAGQAHALELLEDATPAWLAVAVVVECVSLLFYSLLFRRLLGLLRWPVSLGLALRINLAGLAAAHLFSAGGVGGAAVTYRVLQKRGMPHALVLIAVIFQNAFAYLLLFALFAAGLVVLILRGQAGDFATLLAAGFVVLLLIGAGYGFWLLNHPSSLRRRAHQVVGWLERRIKRLQVDPAMLEEYLDGVVDGWRRLHREGLGPPQDRGPGRGLLGLRHRLPAAGDGRVPRERGPGQGDRRLRGRQRGRHLLPHARRPGRRGGRDDRAAGGLRHAVGGRRRGGAGVPPDQLLAADPRRARHLRERPLAFHAGRPPPSGSSPRRPASACLWYCPDVQDRRGGRSAGPQGIAIKKTLIRIVVFAVIVLALYLLLPKLVDTQATIQYISRASYVLLGVAVALEVAALAGYANLFRYILRVLDIRCGCATCGPSRSAASP